MHHKRAFCGAHLQPLYFSETLRNRPSKECFALIVGGMYPVRLCLHILPDVSLCDKSRFLVGPRSVILGDVRFLLNVAKRAGFCSESCGIGSMFKNCGVSDQDCDSNDSFCNVVRRSERPVLLLLRTSGSSFLIKTCF